MTIMTAKDGTPWQTGCIFAAPMGWHNTYRVIDLAREQGMLMIDAYDRETLEAFRNGVETITLDFTEHNVADLVIGQGEMLDKAEEWLNENVASEGFLFGWLDGDFTLAPICDDDQACTDEECWHWLNP